MYDFPAGEADCLASPASSFIILHFSEKYKDVSAVKSAPPQRYTVWLLPRRRPRYSTGLTPSSRRKVWEK